MSEDWNNGKTQPKPLIVQFVDLKRFLHREETDTIRIGGPSNPYLP
jgi:hypothetical protein